MIVNVHVDTCTCTVMCADKKLHAQCGNTKVSSRKDACSVASFTDSDVLPLVAAGTSFLSQETTVTSKASGCGGFIALCHLVLRVPTSERMYGAVMVATGAASTATMLAGVK